MNNNITSSILNSLSNNQSLSANSISGQDSNVVRAAVINLLNDIKTGDLISGQLVAKDNNSIQLLLKNDILLNTKLEENVNLALGKQISFEVTNNQKGQLTLRPMFTNLNNSSTIINALNQANIPASDTSVKMVTELMRNNMPIDRESLLSINKDINQYLEYDPEDIVLLNKMGLEINDNNVLEMHLYRNNNQWMMDSISDAASQLSNMLFEAISSNESNTDALIDGIKKALSAYDDEGESLSINNLPKEANSDTEKIIINDQISKEDSLPIAAKEIVNEVKDDIKNDIKNDIKYDNRLDSKLDNSVDIKADIKADTKSEIPISDNSRLNEAYDINSKNVFDILKNIPFNNFSNKDKLLIKNALLENLKENLLMKPEDLSKEKYVKKYYEKTLEITEELDKILNLNSKSDSDFAKTVNNVKNNMEFMNKINEFYNYVQLPLKMNDKHSNGDLYVYAKKKNRSVLNSSDELTALLHLSMEYLGKIDIFLTLKNGNNLSTKFSLEKEEMIDFIEANIDKLNERLIDKGYSIDSTMVTKSNENRSNPIENILKDEGKRVLFSTGAFDARA